MAPPFPLVNPDITLYYSISPDAGAEFASYTNGKNLIEDLYSITYLVTPPVPANLNISIGSVAMIRTVFDINNNDVNPDGDVFDTINNVVLYFKGTERSTISFNANTYNVLVPFSDEFYTFPANSTFTFEISGGTGDYLNKKGFVQLITDAANINREVKIYFLKTYSASASASATTIDCNGKTVTFTETASATSTVSAEDAEKIAKTVVEDLVNALLSKPC